MRSVPAVTYRMFDMVGRATNVTGSAFQTAAIILWRVSYWADQKACNR